MKYIINYSLSFGSKTCTTCNGSGLITIITADSQLRRPCSSLSCFDSGNKVYTEPRYIISGRRGYSSEKALNHFAERLYRLKMQLAFHYAGEIFIDDRSVYKFYRKGGYIENKGYAELSEVGRRVVKLLPYHNKLVVNIYRKP